MKTITKVIFYFLIFVFVIVALSFLLAQAPSGVPVTTLTLLSYTNINYAAPEFIPHTCLQAKVLWKNVDNMSILYGMSPVSENPYACVTVQSLNSNRTYIDGGMTGYYKVLGPGKSDVFSVSLPTNTVRWRFSFYMVPASFRQRMLYSTGESSERNPLVWISAMSCAIYPEKYRQGIQVKSRIFEIGTNTITGEFPKDKDPFE